MKLRKFFGKLFGKKKVLEDFNCEQAKKDIASVEKYINELKCFAYFSDFLKKEEEKKNYHQNNENYIRSNKDNISKIPLNYKLDIGDVGVLDLILKLPIELRDKIYSYRTIFLTLDGRSYGFRFFRKNQVGIEDMLNFKTGKDFLLDLLKKNKLISSEYVLFEGTVDQLCEEKGNPYIVSEESIDNEEEDRILSYLNKIENKDTAE
jgi:hypothetical protein